MTKEAVSLIVKHGYGFVGQREIFRIALEKGWPGTEPSVLGTYYANQALEWAVDFIRSKGIDT